MLQYADRFFDLFKIVVALFCTASVAFADNNHPISIELCRADSSRVDIEVPAGTTLMHGLSADSKAYSVVLPAAATIHAYVDCLDVEAETNSNETQANDELHLTPDENTRLTIKGNVIRLVTTTGAKRKSGENPKITDRINWPN